MFVTIYVRAYISCLIFAYEFLNDLVGSFATQTYLHVNGIAGL